MKAKFIMPLWLGIITAGLILFSAFNTKSTLNVIDHEVSVDYKKLKKEVSKVLTMKCNICHRKQNTFIIFKENNMSKKQKNSIE